MKISQAEARRLKKRVSDLEARHGSICMGAPGTEIGTLRLERDWFMGRIEMAKRLGCGVVVTEANNVLTFRAIKPL